MKEIRTYMPFNYPVDPAKIAIIPDMDLSYAFGATLVEWDQAKQIRSGLTSRWEIAGEKTYRFILREGAKWSDGSPITARQVKQSFERTLTVYRDDLRSVATMIENIESPSDHVVEFKLTVPAVTSNLLGKLTEPNYGVLKLHDAKSIELGVTAGPFYLERGSDHELVLKQNRNWHRSAAGMADQIVIRKPPKNTDSQTILLEDRWPNLIETSSLIPSNLLSKYEQEHFQIWRRPTDKVFVLELGGRARNTKGFKLLRHLRQHLKATDVTDGLTGATEANQLFPKGYQLHDSGLVCSEKVAEGPQGEVPRRKLDILISPARVSPRLRDNLRKAIASATGIDPNFISLPLQEAFKRKDAGDFDIYAGTYGLADPDPEGIMSFYFEGENPVIPSGDERFVTRLDAARKEQDPRMKLKQMRAIVVDAVCKGHILPLFHLSTVGLAREELDLSSITASDESVTLSKIRFRSQAAK